MGLFSIFLLGGGNAPAFAQNELRCGGLRAAVELQSVYAGAPPRLRRTRFAQTAPGRLRHAEPVRAKRGGPGRTRTCNQTVMSALAWQNTLVFPVFFAEII